MLLKVQSEGQPLEACGVRVIQHTLCVGRGDGLNSRRLPGKGWRNSCFERTSKSPRDYTAVPEVVQQNVTEGRCSQQGYGWNSVVEQSLGCTEPNDVFFSLCLQQVLTAPWKPALGLERCGTLTRSWGRVMVALCSQWGHWTAVHLKHSCSLIISLQPRGSLGSGGLSPGRVRGVNF